MNRSPLAGLHPLATTKPMHFVLRIKLLHKVLFRLCLPVFYFSMNFLWTLITSIFCIFGWGNSYSQWSRGVVWTPADVINLDKKEPHRTKSRSSGHFWDQNFPHCTNLLDNSMEHVWIYSHSRRK